jgi:capsule polysaccharide export protein KpsC/LpsZ
LFGAKRCNIFGRIFFGGKNRPQNRAEKRRRADDKSVKRRVRNAACHHARYAQSRQNKRCGIRQSLPDADEKRLHHKTLGALFFGQIIADKSAKRLHTRIDARVQNP